MASVYPDYEEGEGAGLEAGCKWSTKRQVAPPLQRWKKFSKGYADARSDGRGSMRHTSKRMKQASAYADAQGYSPAHDYSHETQEGRCKSPVSAAAVAFSYPVELKWRWSSDADYGANGFGDSGRSVVKKERAVFVGCIPDGLNDVVEVLQSLMEGFLERFDFIPITLSEIQLVSVMKDYAFLELANEKVAQIVLAANQLDLFEWGSNGCHFNIEGCHGTHTSVRPLIEYMPLRPARVLFVGNIPKPCWQEDYLEEFFSRILWASDEPNDSKLVVGVYLLPESCDAYLELVSECLADALIYKCLKSPQLVRDLGEDVFLCRDVTSIPMMSRHESAICPERSLFIGLSARDEDMKVDCVRKVFDAIMPLISRKVNQPAYLEYISMLPGKDHACFQFNSEYAVDAVMEEYIENTHLFTINYVNLAYIILRPPEYVRPGARYYLDNRMSRQKPYQAKHMQQKLSTNRNTGRQQPVERSKNTCFEPLESDIPVPRSKRADCVFSMGISPPLVATWNGLSFNGENAEDPESMIVIEGITKPISYKLLRGALNELFERELMHSGLLEVGILLVRFLDRDESSDLVACLPSAEFVHALLSLRKVFLVAGHEVRLLPKSKRNAFARFIPGIMHNDDNEMSYSSEEAEDWGDVHGPAWNKRQVHFETADQLYQGANSRRDVRQGANHEWGPSQKRIAYKGHFHNGPRSSSRGAQDTFCRQMEGNVGMHLNRVPRTGIRVHRPRGGMHRTG